MKSCYIILLLSLTSICTDALSQDEFIKDGEFFPLSSSITINFENSFFDEISFAKDEKKAFVILSRFNRYIDRLNSYRVRGRVTLILEDKSFIYLNDYSEYYQEDNTVYTIYRLTESEVSRLLDSEVSKIIYNVPERLSSSGPLLKLTNVAITPKPNQNLPFVKDVLSSLYAEDIQISSTDLSLESRRISNKVIIELVRNPSGIFEVPVILNDVLKINFILDSGASSVFVTPDIVLILIRAGSLTERDFIGETQYKLADGSVITSRDFYLRKLKIGDIELINVEASVSENIEASLLLGQSALNKLGKYIIDYSNEQMIIEQ